MNTPASETTLQRERRLFRELWSHLLDLIISKAFDLSPQQAAWRRSILTIFFFVTGFIISLIYYPLGLWVEHIADILYSILNPSVARFPVDVTVVNFINFLIQIVLDQRLLQYLPVFIAPYFIALQSAAIYLADIFELEDITVARNFVSSVALTGGGGNVIHIKHGEVIEEHMETPAFLIGGPAKVLVELDSVALFERADGTPHIIGPTGKEPGGKATLDGFERFRQSLDIRNHHVDLRDQDSNSKAVLGRSRDGIPIKATDVRLMFSVYRGENPETSPENPYPISKEAIEQIVYKASSRVTPEMPNPSTFEFNWTPKMIGLIRGRLGQFMSERNLSEYLASVGLPEFEKVKQREKNIREEMLRITQSDDDGAAEKEIKPPPDFQSRYKVKNLFAQFADGFSSQARNSGVELHWIGVGTWESPLEIVPSTHLEAWKITQENLKADSPSAMNAIEHKEIIERTKELIKEVPIAPFLEMMEAYRPKKTGKQGGKHKETPIYQWAEETDWEEGEEEETDPMAEVLDILHDMHGDKEEDEEPINIDHARDAQGLLLEYRKQFQKAVDFIRAKNETVPQNILDAIRHIDNQIGHWAGRP